MVYKTKKPEFLKTLKKILKEKYNFVGVIFSFQVSVVLWIFFSNIVLSRRRKIPCKFFWPVDMKTGTKTGTKSGTKTGTKSVTNFWKKFISLNSYNFSAFCATVVLGVWKNISLHQRFHLWSFCLFSMKNQSYTVKWLVSPPVTS